MLPAWQRPKGAGRAFTLHQIPAVGLKAALPGWYLFRVPQEAAPAGGGGVQCKGVGKGNSREKDSPRL